MIKNFQKFEGGDWALLVDDALSSEELDFVNKEDKSDDELAELKELYKKCETTVSEDDSILLNKCYDYFIKKENLEDKITKIAGLHVTSENNKLRGIFNYFIDEGFYQFRF
jgi:hypothetical protein